MGRVHERSAWGWSALIVAMIGALVACAGASLEPPAAVPQPTATISHGTRHGTQVEQPPPFIVRYGLIELALEPVTYCFRSGCVDGIDEDPPRIGSPDELFVFVPISEFDELSVSQVEGGDGAFQVRGADSAAGCVGRLEGDPRWPRRYPEPAGGAVGRAGAARALGFQVLRRSLSRSAIGMDRSRGVLPPAAGYQTGADGALR